jgi:cyclase
VGAAVAKGLSLEATLKVVSMTQYNQYSLFDWVHNTVNVPAVYQAIRRSPK